MRHVAGFLPWKAQDIHRKLDKQDSPGICSGKGKGRVNSYNLETVLRTRRIRSKIVRGLEPQTISQILQQCYEKDNALKLLLCFWILTLHQGHFKSPHFTIP